MSINFNAPVNEETRDLLRGLYGKSVANDGKQFLYDQLGEIRQLDMKELTKRAGQAAVVEIHGTGDIKTMSDGTQYQATANGWRRVKD